MLHQSNAFTLNHLDVPEMATPVTARLPRGSPLDTTGGVIEVAILPGSSGYRLSSTAANCWHSCIDGSDPDHR